MALEPGQIEHEMRLSAIEFVLCKLTSSILKGTGRTDAQLAADLNQIADHAKTQSFPALDAVQSDMSSDEFSIAVRRLCDLIREMAAKLSSP
jgi:hypothetical protein